MSTRKLLLFLCFFYFFSCLSKASVTDSLPERKKTGFNLSINVSPVMFCKWNIPGHNQVYSQKLQEDKSDKTLTKSFFSPLGLQLSYNLKHFISIGIGACYYHEKTFLYLLNTENSDYNEQINLSVFQNVVQTNVNMGYIRIDKNDLRKETKINIGVSCEFTNSETLWEKYVYSKTGDVIFSEEHDFNKLHPGKYVFNKWSSFLYLGRVIYNKKKNISLNYGAMVISKPLYQKHNHDEYLENYKIIPLIVGISFYL
jgi:hypothetical protein